MISSRLTRFLKEVRRRGLYGVLALYVVTAWVALQAADLAFPGWDIPESAIRYVWIAAMLLFPLAVLFGWRYDVTTRGIEKTPAVADTQSPPLQQTDRLIIGGLLVITVGVCVVTLANILGMRVTETLRPVVADIPTNSIAVLPFVNMSDDESN